MKFHPAHTRLAALLTVVIASVAALSACSVGESDPDSARRGAPTAATATSEGSPTSAPTDPVAAAAWEALMAPDGEYDAAASYSAVIEEFGPVEPYVSIKAAEEQHIAALTRQLQRLGVSVPANPWLGQDAPADLATAAQAWADSEVTNVALYDRLMVDASSDATLTRVFTNLRRASLEQHLPLFEAAAANGGTLSADQMPSFGH